MMVLIGLLALFAHEGLSAGGAIQVGVLYAFISYLGRMIEPLIEMTNQLNQLQQAMVAGLAIFSLVFGAGLETGQGPGLMFVTLPLAFAHAELRDTAGWKSQIESAERLARAGVIAPNVLLGLYTERLPAASGGVWDRAAAFQRFESALTSW